MELHELPSVSGASLTVTFTVNHIDLVKSFRIDVLEQDDNFVTLQTLNYTITEAVYKEGTACIAGLSTKAQFLVCVRVEYSDIGEDSTCSRTKTSKEAAQTNVSCQFPTSRRVEDREDGTSSPTSEYPLSRFSYSKMVCYPLSLSLSRQSQTGALQ